jgi:ribonucleoside-diphosphate reductase alpha chain
MKEEILERRAGGNGQMKPGKGVEFRRYYTREGISPYDTVEWEYRTAAITSESGEVIFEQKNVEVPKTWSMTATNIVASKYFHGKKGTPERETSVRQLIGRVATTIKNWGLRGGYFATPLDAQVFHDELAHLLLNQMMAFNSPVWFNCGVEEKPQCSACFINAVEDTMGSILDLAKTEGMLFKWGSGTGSNLSGIRSSKETLSGGGTASGPVSFMKGFDAFAGVIKSGGKTRRAAKMVILNAAHPDIMEFINSKANEEKKAWVLLDNGYGGGVDGEAYSSVFFQNANHSVRVTDEFMQAVVNDGEWKTRAITNGDVVDTYKARDMMRQIADSAYICGDPGMQYDTTVNRWHTSKNTAPINASNPCSEYMFLDDSACNLASLNLMKFDKGGKFDVESFRKAVDITITAQEIIVGFASYPTKKIEINSFDYRPLGLGYANLGALLMSQGMAYDSDLGRDCAAAITAIMTGEAYLQSAKIAAEVGPCAGYESNKKPFLEVMRMHRDAVRKINRNNISAELYDSAWNAWSDAVDLGELNGYRNAQASVLAPTGTIGFMMDCDTTGVEPDLALVKYKKLVGGGTIKIVNNTVPAALQKLGYDDPSVKAIVEYINDNGTIEGAPGLQEQHLTVFDCAFKPMNGVRSIHYMGHLKMMGAVQPFISGAISKTVNLPSEVTVEEIEKAYIEGWRLGLKAVAIYRDGSKRTQPMSTSSTEKKYGAGAGKPEGEGRPVRRHLPVERHSITHKFGIAGHEGYLTIGMYEDGAPGEIFIVMAKEGSTLSGVMDSFATTCSMALQYGVPLKILVDKFSHTRFEPSGFTSNPQVPYAKSVMDYIFRYLASKFLPVEEARSLGVQVDEAPLTNLTVMTQSNPTGSSATAPSAPVHSSQPMIKGALVDIQDRDAPVCFECGSLMVRNGACYKCLNCGSTSGCS